MFKKIPLLIIATIMVVGCTQSHTDLYELQQAFESDQYNKAFKISQELALEGDPDAQYTLGYLFYSGLGTEKNIPLGEYWIQIAAEQGQANAVHAMQLIQQSRLLAPNLPDSSSEDFNNPDQQLYSQP